MASLVDFGRLGRGLLLVALVGVIAGCTSGGEPSSIPPTTAIPGIAEPAGLEVDEFGIVDISAITAGFVPEITEGDIEVAESDSGTLYIYSFPTRELTDGVTVDLQARWDPVEDGLQPGLEWKLAGDEASPSEFGFVVSIPKSFGASPSDMTFDPQPTEIVDADVVAKWTVDPIKNPIVTALSGQLVQQGDPAAVIMMILDRLNDQRIHAELTACHSSFRDAETIPQCYLAVVTRNARHFGTQSCDILEKMIVAASADDLSTESYHGFAAACGTVVELASSGATGGCERLADDSEAYAGCLIHVSRLMMGECPIGDALERQICVYDIAVALEFSAACNVIERLGSTEMANDCRATTEKDPKYCARTNDATLRASCCEVFRGTDAFETCLGTQPDITTTTGAQDTTTTVVEATATTEPGEEDLPPAIPAGVYTGSFDARLMADVIGQDSGIPEINTMTIGIDGEGLVSGHLHVHQEGLFLGCTGAMSDWVGTVDPGQIIGPRLPLTVTAMTKTMETSPFYATWADAQCLTSPEIEYNQGPLSLVFDTIQGGSLSGVAQDYVPFELQLVP